MVALTLLVGRLIWTWDIRNYSGASAYPVTAPLDADPTNRAYFASAPVG